MVYKLMLIKELCRLNEGVNDPHIFKAIFMAGGPGSGKSTIVTSMVAHTGLRIVDIDNFWKLYKTKSRTPNYDHFAMKGKVLRNLFVQGRLGLVIDGTSRKFESTQETKEKLESLGYDTLMIFVDTDLDIALDRVKSRADRTGRQIDTELVRGTWTACQEIKEKFRELFSENFFLIPNNTPNTDTSKVTRAVNRWLAIPPSHPAAIQWINDQKKSNTTGIALRK